MDSLAAKIEANRQKRQALEAELEQDQTALQLLLAHPRGELPEAVPSNVVVTAAAASALQAADEEKRRRDEADAIRCQSDLDTADKARHERMDRLRQLAFAVDTPVSAAPRHRARSGSPERPLPRPLKQTRFAQPDPHDSDEEEEELSILPAALSRPTYLIEASKLLLYLVNSTCSPCPPMIPTLRSAHTLVYAAALAHVNSQLRVHFGADRPSFHHFLYILRELPQFFPALFADKTDKEAMATTAATRWHRLFSNELTRLLRLADDCRQYVDAQFPVFITALDEAEPRTFDPVALFKKHVSKLSERLTDSKSKQLLRSMYPAPAKSNGSRDKDSGTNWGGAGEGGDVDQIPGPGPPGSFWHWSHDCFVRYVSDASGHRLTHICMMCGWSGTPSHNASHCPADESEIANWVELAIPVV
jgi:hypothetical protein